MYLPPKVKPLCPPEQSPRFADVVYAQVTLDNGQPHDLKLDVYQSPEQQEPGPCIVYYFGGGWLWGGYKQTTQKAVYCRDLVRLTQQGYTIVCPDYRLASQSVFPACIHDCKAVIRFLKANAAAFHIAPQRIGVLGNSAGAHLAAMVALSSDHPELEGTVGGNLEQSSSVKAACMFYTPADLEQSLRDAVAALNGPERDLAGTEIENIGDNRDRFISALIVGYTGKGRSLQSLEQVMDRNDPTDPDWPYIELTRRCSPIHYASASNPPVCLLHGGNDRVVPLSQSLRLYQALINAGADATFVSYSLGGHGPSLGESIDRFAYRFLMERL